MDKIQKFDYEEINLIPKLCIVNSRNDCDTTVILGKFKFETPIIPANMECILDERLAENLSSNGYFYSMHRFDIDPIAFTKNMKAKDLVSSISIGVNEDSFLIIDRFKEENIYPDFITVDIAHGHSNKMKTMLEKLKVDLPDSFVIAGNVSTSDGVKALDSWGADAIKVGIGPGKACTTWPSTGFGSRNFQASVIYNACLHTTKPIIADGGIKVPGDIAKSLVLGAKMVMIGGMLAGFNDSPGEIVSVGGVFKKEFWGSASQYQSGKKDRIEGIKILVDFKNKSIIDEMKYLKECLQSSISYGGGTDLSCFDSVHWI